MIKIQHILRKQAQGDADSSKSRFTPWLPSLYCILIAAYPALSLYATNTGDVSPAEMARPFAVSVLAALALLLVFSWLLRDRHRGGLLTVLLVLLFFTYGHAAKSLGIVTPVVWLGILIATAAWLLLKRPNLAKVAPAITIAALAICAAPAATIATQSGKALLQEDSEWEPELFGFDESLRQHEGPPPDIYWIIPDAYARGDVLRYYYLHDNAPFLHALEERGFQVLSRSTSNYHMTYQSMASQLNMAYLHELKLSGALTNNVLKQAIHHNPLTHMLAQAGYQIEIVHSGSTLADITPLHRDWDFGDVLSDFEKALLTHSAWQLFAGQQDDDYLYTMHRQGIEDVFDTMVQIPGLPADSPRLVICHIASPHPPFVFGPEGQSVTSGIPFTYLDGSNIVKPGSLTPSQYRDRYVAQLQYTNMRLIEIIDAILAAEERPAVILLQSDHGPRLTLDWPQQDPVSSVEIVSNLTACRLPGFPKPLPDNLSSRSVLSHILRHYLGMQTPPENHHESYQLITTQDKEIPIVSITDQVQNPDWTQILLRLAEAGRPTYTPADYLVEVAKLSPKDDLVQNMVGTVLFNESQHSAAEAYFLRAAELAPHNPVYYYNLGMLYTTQQRLPAATEALDTAYSLAEKAGANQWMERIAGQRAKLADPPIDEK